MKKIFILPMVLLGIQLYAQNNHTVNNGNLAITPGTVVSTHFDFQNNASGNVLNDGDFYFDAVNKTLYLRLGQYNPGIYFDSIE